MRGDTALRAQAPTRTVIQRDDVRIEMLAQGSGRLVVLLPSLGAARPISIDCERIAYAGTLWTGTAT